MSNSADSPLRGYANAAEWVYTHGIEQEAWSGEALVTLTEIRHVQADRGRYLAALGHADEGDCRLLGELVARAILDNLHRFVVPAVARKEQLVPRAPVGA